MRFEVQFEVNFTFELPVLGFIFVWKSVNGLTYKQALNVESVIFGIVWLRARVTQRVLQALYVVVLLIIEFTAVI
jgi:hypothetical protein